MLENDGELLDDDEEDVVIAGSELHEALNKMGYSDYEVVSAIDGGKLLAGTTTGKPESKNTVPGLLGKNFSQLYQRLAKDSRDARAQLTLISEADHLLDDHMALIRNLLDEGSQTQLRGMEKLLTYLQCVAGTSALFCFVNRPNLFGSLLVLPALMIARFKYAKYSISRDLRKLLSDQTELHYTYKKSLRILMQYFGTKIGAKQSGIMKFVDLTAEKLKFLQPVTEKTLQSLRTLSVVYHRTTLRLVDILPDSQRRFIESQITRFDVASFSNCGVITYETLKKLFYRFILIQSEMLLTLAVFIDSESHGVTDQMKRTIILEKTIEKLSKSTTSQRISMGRIIDDFHNYKLTPVERNYRGIRGSKWQDLYIRLYLTSHKMQNAYNTLNSVLEDIENHLDRRTDEAELLQRLKIQLDEVCGYADKARELTQLSALLITKMERVSSGKGEKGGELQGDLPAENSRSDVPIVRDSDPVIVDEVFEEYIRERYPEGFLDDDGDDYLETSYKLDRLLSKNLMSELKEALIDKERDTKKRESRALERMGNKNAWDIPTIDDETRKETVSPDSEAETGSKSSVIIRANESREAKTGESNSVPKPPPLPKIRELVRSRRGEEKVEQTVERVEEKEIDCRMSRFFIPVQNSAPVSLPLFLSNNEETFIGSGENSDEEIIDVNESIEETEESWQS